LLALIGTLSAGNVKELTAKNLIQLQSTLSAQKLLETKIQELEDEDDSEDDRLQRDIKTSGERARKAR
jgi:hypothetical protein